MKRIIAFLMALMILVPHLPVPKAAANEVPLEGLITQQYDDFVYKLTGGSVKDATDRLVNHSIKGGGTLNMGQNDTFTKALLSTNLFRADFIDAAATAITYMQSSGSDKVFMRGGVHWYNTRMRYYNTAYQDNENGNDSDDPAIGISASYDYWNGRTNEHDDSMILVVGSSHSRMTFRQIEATADAVTYSVLVRIYDTFDFSGADYSGSSTSLAQLITWLGFLLSFGLLSEFDWTATAELTLTVPNSCTHSSANYRWGFDGKQDLVTEENARNKKNALTKLDGTALDGVFSQTYYMTDHPIFLFHDKPWELEFTCIGTGSFAFSSNQYMESGMYFRKLNNLILFGEKVYKNETDTEKTHCQYGMDFIRGTSEEKHTYCLKNCVNADGSNMVYLFLDGIEMGPMNRYYESSAYQKVTSDGLNGKNLVFSYLGNISRPFENVAVDYIQVWENGRDNDPFTYCTSRTVAPTCTSDGYTQNTCTLCGAVFKTDSAPATGHSFGAYTSNSDATCTTDGTKTAKCSTCGTTDTVADPGTARNHSFGAWDLTKSATCTAEGEERRDCENCDHYETRSLAQTAHEWTTSVMVEPSCTETGTQEKTCRNCDALETYEIPAKGHSWVDASVPMKRCDICGFAESSCQIRLPEELESLETVWVDGEPYPAESGRVTLEEEAFCLTVYAPEMQIYELHWTGESYEANHIPELDGLIEFAGTDLRTEGAPGIRIITAMERETREALQGDGLAGYTLVEAGTVTSFAGTSPVLGQPEAKSNHAYRKGEADPIYKKTKDQILYTNVLVGYSPRQYQDTLSVRPYCILEKDGQQLTVYGAVMTATLTQLMQK